MQKRPNMTPPPPPSAPQKNKFSYNPMAKKKTVRPVSSVQSDPTPPLPTQPKKIMNAYNPLQVKKRIKKKVVQNNQGGHYDTQPPQVVHIMFSI
jgi:hypothetical protein